MKVLIFVGLLYLMSGSFCTLNSHGSAEYLGLALTTNSGLVEYITVYGGLQIGLGLAMVLCGFRRSYLEAALFFVFVFSAALAVFRMVTLSVIGVSTEMTMLAILEWVIMIVVGVAWYLEKSKSPD